MTVQDNIALPLSLNGAPQREIIRKVQARAVDFGLESHLRKVPLSAFRRTKAKSCQRQSVDYKTTYFVCR